MQRVIDRQINRKDWTLFASENKYYSVFQSPEFYDFFNSVKGLKAHVLAVLQNNKLQALCLLTIHGETGIKKFFSRRAICYGGPLVIDENPTAFELLLKELKDFIKDKCIYLEIRNSNNYSNYKEFYLKHDFIYIPYTNVKLNFSNITLEELVTLMKHSRRREIKLSLKVGVRYQEAQNLNEISILYTILKDLYKERVKLPLPSLEYFIKLFESNIGKVFISIYENNIIGGSFCLYDHKCIYTLYYCGLRDYKPNVYSTHLAIIGALNFAIANNITRIDFMGAGKAYENYGVRKYKLGFGGKLVEDGRFVYISNLMLYKVGNFGLKILRKLS